MKDRAKEGKKTVVHEKKTKQTVMISSSFTECEWNGFHADLDDHCAL